MILEDQVFIPFVVMHGCLSCTFQLDGFTSVPCCSGDMSFRRIPFYSVSQMLGSCHRVKPFVPFLLLVFLRRKVLLELRLGFADLFRQFALFLIQSIVSCGGFGMIFEYQVFIPFVAMHGCPSCTFQLVRFTSVLCSSGNVSLRRIPFFIGEPDAWVLAHAVPIHLAIKTKEFS